MGNKRQQLKDKIAADLKQKIENGLLTLSKLKSEQVDVEKNCAQVTADIQHSADSIAQQLNLRKTKLVEEVKALGQTQFNSLQTNIETTYHILGSLQSTLSNLESFDDSQLLNLQIPDLSNNACSSKRCWGIETDWEQLQEKIDNWGIITVNSDNVVEDETTSRVQACVEWVGTVIESVHVESNVTAPGNKLDIEQWLATKLEVEIDDFEMLVMEPEIKSYKVTSSTSSSDSVVPDLDDKNSVCEGTAISDASSSRIICVSQIPEENIETGAKFSEMSMWLKPRNTKPTVPSTTATFAPVPPEMIKKLNTSVNTSTVSSKSHLLDYPGLRLDPRCWLPKKSKGQQDLFKLSAEISMNMSEKEIIPPTFAALPYPFWLKKC